MATSIFVNLPVKDLKRSMAFWTKLGYEFNPQFTDENAACMVVSDTIYVMLLTEAYFQTFAPKPVADATKTTETIIALTQSSKDGVTKFVEKAFAAGAKRYGDPKDYGFMLQWGFEDLDGHIWEQSWMDPAGLPKQ